MFKTIEEYKEHMRKIKEDPDYRNEFKLKRDENIKRYWLTLNKFEKEEDVPTLPNPLTDFYINKLVELGAIPKDKLEDGVLYYGNYRNTNLGKWNKKTEKFDHYRYKFGFQMDDCNHFEDDDGFALFVPLRKANEEELEHIKKIENETD